MLVFFQIKAFSNAGLKPSCAALLPISNVEPEEDILKGHYPIIFLRHQWVQSDMFSDLQHELKSSLNML